jgi:hypothetical protein
MKGPHPIPPLQLIVTGFLVERISQFLFTYVKLGIGDTDALIPIIISLYSPLRKEEF